MISGVLALLHGLLGVSVWLCYRLACMSAVRLHLVVAVGGLGLGVGWCWSASSFLMFDWSRGYTVGCCGAAGLGGFDYPEDRRGEAGGEDDAGNRSVRFLFRLRLMEGKRRTS